MKVVYTNTLEQIADFNLYTFTRSPHSKRNILNGRMFVLVYMILTIIYAIFRLEAIDRILIISFISIIGLLWFFLFPKFYKASIKDEVRAKYRHGRLTLDEITIEFVENQVIVLNKSEKTLIDEQILSEIVILEDKVYLIMNEENKSLVVPYSAFDTDNDKQVFIDYLNKTYSSKITKINGNK